MELFEIYPSVIARPLGANPAGARQSADTVKKIASSGKERPSRNHSDVSVADIFVIYFSCSRRSPSVQPARSEPYKVTRTLSLYAYTNINKHPI